MPKPTFIQTLLHRPSQTYLNLEPQSKEYFSVKPELLRIAAEERQWQDAFSNSSSSSAVSVAQTRGQLYPPPDSDLDNNVHHSLSISSLATLRTASTGMAPMASPPQVRRDPPPRAAGGMVAAAIQQRQPSISSVVAQNPYQPPRQQRPSPTTSRARAPPTKATNLTDDESDLDGFDSSDEGELDIFYTPNQSPRTSMASSSILFPSKARNTTPRQASRKSLRISNPSSGAIVAPGMAASNSGSSIKPNQSHVNNGPSATVATSVTPSSMPQGGSQQQKQTQQRTSYTNHAQPTSNGSASRKPVPSASQVSQASTSKPLLQHQPPNRKGSVPVPAPPSSQSTSTSTLTRPPPSQDSSTPRPSSTSAQTRTPTRSNSVKTLPSTDNTSTNLSRATSTPIRSSTATATSSASPNSSFTTAASNLTANTQRPLPKQKSKMNPTPLLSNSSSNVSLSSTSLENHSDIFSANGSASDMLTESTTVTSPLNSSDGGHGTAKKQAGAPLVNGAAKSLAARSASLRATRTPLPPRSQTLKHPAPSTQSQLQKNYAYTDDDWAKDVRLLVNLNSALEESLNEEQRVGALAASAANGADLKRNGSAVSNTKKEEQRKSLGFGQPAETKGNNEAAIAAVDKGKAKEKDGKEGKIKRKKTGAVADKDVVYYTAKHGTPRPPPPALPAPAPVNGAVNGVGSSTTRSYPSPPPSNQQLLPPPMLPAAGRNGYHHQTSIMMNMSALIEEDEVSDGRLSVVTERDEPETPTVPNGELHTSAVFNAFAPLRPTTNNQAQPVEMMRRRSRSMGEHDALEDQAQKPARQSSVTSWADEYKEILEKTRGQAAMASGASLLSSPSQHSFAYRNALPVPSGELPSQGTPGYTSLHLARAPPGVYAKDGEVHQRLGNGAPQAGGFMGGLKGAVHGTPPGMSANGRVDLTRSGIAQTAMASVEVVKGLGAVKRGLSGVFSLGGLGRRRTVSGGEGMDLLENKRRRARKGSEDVNATGRGGLLDPTAARPLAVPPGSSVGPDRVLGFTGYRRPPTYVPSGSVLVQVWAVGVDGVDAKLVGLRMGKRRAELDDEDEEGLAGETARQSGAGAQMNGIGKEGEMNGKGATPPGRSMSLRSRLGSLSRRKGSISGSKKDTENGVSIDWGSKGKAKTKGKGKDKALPAPPISHPEVGYIPGRSFVGRVLDCGWDVKDETIRRGEWVVGLLDVRKCGALTEYIVIDRHRVHRIPYPSMPGADTSTTSTSSATTNTTNTTNTTSSGSSSRTAKPAPPQPLTLEQLALLPLCGVPAYRAVRTLMYAFSAQYKPPTSPKQPSGAEFLGGRNHLLSDHEANRRRRALVLRGHDGVGAMAVQMLALRGWRVSVHVPVSGSHNSEDVKRYMLESEERVRKLGGEEVVFDDGGIAGDPWWDDGRAAAVRMINGLCDDGDVFDAIIDTLGGREIREASERLLKSHGALEEAGSGKAMIYLDGQSPVGKGTKKSGIGQFTTVVGEVPERTIPTTADNFRAGLRSLKFGSGGGGGGGREYEEGGKTKVGYAWISVAQDVDWEGDDIAESIGNVLLLGTEHGVRPIVQRASTTDEYSPEYHWQTGVIPFEKTPEIFVNGDGPLSSGGTMVIKVAA